MRSLGGNTGGRKFSIVFDPFYKELILMYIIKNNFLSLGRRRQILPFTPLTNVYKHALNLTEAVPDIPLFFINRPILDEEE